jgi:hypothetical protein
MRWYDGKGEKTGGIKTKAVVQQEVDELYTGTKIPLGQSLAEILFYSSLTLCFGVGMPLLYCVQLTYLLVLFWTQKWLILNYYDQSKLVSHKLFTFFLFWLNVVFLVHFYTSYRILTNKSIFPGLHSRLGYQKQEIPAAYKHL